MEANQTKPKTSQSLSPSRTWSENLLPRSIVQHSAAADVFFFPRLVRLLSWRLPLATCVTHCCRLHTRRPPHASLHTHLSSLQLFCGNRHFHKYREVDSVLQWTQRFAFSASVVPCNRCSLLFFFLKVAVRVKPVETAEQRLMVRTELCRQRSVFS